MASRRALDRAVRRLRMDDSHIDELAEKLYVTKRRVYRRSLAEEAHKLGYRLPLPRLSDEVDGALRAEARDHAERIAATYNADLEKQAAELADQRSDQVESKLRTWAVARQRKRATPTAITEAYSAHADAQLSTYLDLGLPESTLFDFGGHPELGDQPAACPICIALERANPHPLDRVIAVGNPHPACRQNWHLNTVDQRSLPPEQDVALGQTLAGIVGRDSLITRTGSRDAAVEAIGELSQ